MTVPQFSRPGAVDLSALIRPTTPGSAGPPGATGGPGSDGPAGQFVIDVVDEQALRQDVVERSLTVVVLASFWSPESPAVGRDQRLAVAPGRRVRRPVPPRPVDVAAHPELAQALGIPQSFRWWSRAARAARPAHPGPAARGRAARVARNRSCRRPSANGVTGVSPPVSPGSDAERPRPPRTMTRPTTRPRIPGPKRR